MLSDSIYLELKKLTETASIKLAQSIQSQPILTPISDQPILTTYVHSGQSETPILLLHGFDSSLLEFRRLFPLLAAEQETWAVDLLGFGFTERQPLLKFGISDLKAHLYAFWETLIQKPVILVGASMGGATALDFTLTYPKAVKKLVLIDSAGLAKPPTIGKFMFSPLDFLATAFLQNLRVRQKISEAAYYDKTFANLDAQCCAALHLKTANWNKALIAFTKGGGYGSFKDSLSQIQQKTLILWGENDKILGTADAERFEALIPNSQLIWIQKCGHVPHLEQPSMTAKHILEFGYSNLK